MNERTKNILEDFGQKQIGLDDTFRFHCTICGKCCINREDILLNALDVYNLAKELKISTGEVLVKYCESYIGSVSRMMIVRLLPVGSVKRCPLLKDRKCSVHNAKPTVCALYPLGRGMEMKAGETVDFTKLKTRYFLQDTACGDKSEEHTVRSWLRDFNIPEQDSFYPKWTQTITDIGNMVKQMESHISDHVMELVLQTILICVYLKYSTDEPFMPQFEKNVAEFMELMRKSGITPQSSPKSITESENKEEK